MNLSISSSFEGVVTWFRGVQAKNDLQAPVTDFINLLMGTHSNHILTDDGFNAFTSSLKTLSPFNGKAENLTWEQFGMALEDAASKAVDKAYWKNDKTLIQTIFCDAETVKKAGLATAIKNADAYGGTAVSITVRHVEFTPADLMDILKSAQNINDFAAMAGYGERPSTQYRAFAR